MSHESRLPGAAYNVEAFDKFDFSFQYMNVGLVDTYRMTQGTRLDVFQTSVILTTLDFVRSAVELTSAPYTKCR
jgi:hypothetical protein